MIVAPTSAVVDSVHVSFVSNPWERVILTKNTFESKIFIFPFWDSKGVFVMVKNDQLSIFFTGQAGLFSPGMKKDMPEFERWALYSTATHAHTHTWQHPWTRPTEVRR